MYQKVSRSLKPICTLGAALLLSAVAAQAQDAVKCRDTISNSARKYTNKSMKALQKCEEGVLKGSVVGPCPDAKAAGQISGAAAKLADKVNSACTGVTLADMGFAGKVSRCSGGTGDGNRCVDDEDCEFPPIAAGPEDGVCTAVDECPAFLNGTLLDGCEAITLSTPQTVADCIECASLAKVESVVGTFYDSLTAPAEDKDDAKCQVEIGKRAAKYFDAVEKALTSCERSVIKGKIPGPCPDAKALDKITKKLATLDDKIGDACGDAARLARAIKPAQLYSTASRYGSCGVAAAATGAGLADLLECLAENSATCDVALALGSNACSTQLCGNGQIDPGETCDSGDTLHDNGVGPADVCPADCTTNTACVGGGTVNVTVTFTSAVPVGGMVLVLPYNDDKVMLPGPGASDVSARLTSVDFSAQGTDLEYGLRATLTDPSFAGIPSGTAMTIQFDTCTGAPALANTDLGCMVADASDAAFATIGGVSCTATVGP